jgi:hypothetical protein
MNDVKIKEIIKEVVKIIDRFLVKNVVIIATKEKRNNTFVLFILICPKMYKQDKIKIE